MNKEQLFQEVLGKIRQRFPDAIAGLTSFRVHDWNDEQGLTHMLHDILARCGSDKLDASYAQHVKSLHEQEAGPHAGVGMANSSLELKCRALIRALDAVA